MSILILYATIEGQTGKIARFAEDHIRTRGQDVSLFDTCDKLGQVSLGGIDKVILGAPCMNAATPKRSRSSSRQTATIWTRARR